MSEVSLRQLRNTLESNHWIVLDELEGDDYKFSGFWKIARPDNTSRLTIAFDGLDDMQTLPMEKAYGFQIVEFPDVGASMRSHRSKTWQRELKEFIKLLNKVNN